MSRLGDIYTLTPVQAISLRSSDSNPTYSNRDVHFLPLFGFLLSFLLLLYTIQLITEVYTFFSVFPFLSLHNSTCKRGILSSSLWISVFFSLHNSTCNRGILSSSLWISVSFRYTIQLGIIEQKYFLSGVAWIELDKLHYYQMRLIFPFINYQRFGYRSYLFKIKIATDPRVNL
ncbi:unnamed protein product [Acanthosepion pharaonis]|uniref:Uncharacterized protein n=1 Tax=Acanthosepion pharaonis TaxID=158019 RepID=A0A812AXN8_ACAPH|nr:unnamed protein product [Sepia pharaonis]